MDRFLNLYYKWRESFCLLNLLNFLLLYNCWSLNVFSGDFFFFGHCSLLLCWFVLIEQDPKILFPSPNFLGGVDSSFVPLQCFLWYSQCLLFQKSFHLDTRKRKEKNFQLMLLAMMMLSKRSQVPVNKWTRKCHLWDLGRMSEVRCSS